MAGITVTHTYLRYYAFAQTRLGALSKRAMTVSRYFEIDNNVCVTVLPPVLPLQSTLCGSCPPSPMGRGPGMRDVPQSFERGPHPAVRRVIWVKEAHGIRVLAERSGAN